METTIGVAEAKARLSEVIDRVEAGETIIIARNGEPIVELRSVRRASPQEVVQRIRAISERVRKRNAGKGAWPADGRSLREIAHDGHRF